MGQLKFLVFTITFTILAAMIVGCAGPAAPTPTATPTPTPTSPPASTAAPLEERPDPHIGSGTPVVTYEYYRGFMLGSNVHVTVTNRGGPGIVEIIYEIIAWPSSTSGKKTQSRFVYLDAGEKRKVSNFIPLPTGAKSLTVEVTAYSPDRSAVDSLIQDLYHEDLQVRQNATIALGNFHIKRAVEPLIRILEDDESNVMRSEAASALGKVGDETAIKPLIKALEDDEKSVRVAAIEALGRIGDKRAVEPLIGIFEDDESDAVRSEAAKSLGKIGDETVVEPLISALEDSILKYSVRKAAAEALGNIGDKRAVEPLIRALEDDDIPANNSMRTEAAKSLGKIGDERAIESLKAFVNDKRWFLRDAVSSALQEIRGK